MTEEELDDITLTPDEYRWLLNAELDMGDSIYKTLIITHADRLLANGLTIKRLARVERYGRNQYVVTTINGTQWLEQHKGQYDCLPSWQNRMWRRLLNGSLELDYDSSPYNDGNPTLTTDYEELRLLGILTHQQHADGRGTLIITPHGEKMTELGNKTLSH